MAEEDVSFRIDAGLVVGIEGIEVHFALPCTECDDRRREERRALCTYDRRTHEKHGAEPEVSGVRGHGGNSGIGGLAPDRRVALGLAAVLAMSTCVNVG